MRQSLQSSSVCFLKYQIREVVGVAKHIEKLDPTMNIVWENIGDPIAKGWTVPPFLKDILKEEVDKAGDKVFGYSHSHGLPHVREWVCAYVKRFCPKSTLESEDVLFTSGLGSAIAILYQMLPDNARILQPTPTYPTHASFESFRHKKEPVVYSLNAKNNWQPDIEDIEKQLIKHPEVVGILVINPNNPTGSVYSRQTLESIVQLAQKYNVFIIADEIYFRLVYEGNTHEQMVSVVGGRVPLIVMRGLSKDVPWPGGRCGWIEFHNRKTDNDFQEYVNAVKQRILLEVCSTTLPQTVLPNIYDHPEFEGWLSSYTRALAKSSTDIYEILRGVRGLCVNKTQGAFYMMPYFDEGVLRGDQTLPIENPDVRAFIESEVKKPGMTPDKRFTYYLLGATGICVVPATGFFSPTPGFRLTTLERDEQKRKHTYSRVSSAIEEYISS